MATSPDSRSPGTAGSGARRPSAGQALRGPLIALVAVLVLGVVAVVWGRGNGNDATDGGGPVADVD